MNARFYAPDVQAEGELTTLPPYEAQHLTRVLRLSVGDRVRVFNGRGGEFEGVVESAGKEEARVRVGPRRAAVPETRVAVTLVQAVLKGDKMDEVVRDAVMMGVSAIQPIVSERSETSIAALERGRRIDRWQRIAISSAKQCGRAVVPPIRQPLSFEALRRTLGPLTMQATVIMLVEPGASPDAVALGSLNSRAPAEATLLIGPEGGWAPEEVRAAGADCRLVTLGERTLRADAMAIIALAAAFTKWGEF